MSRSPLCHVSPRRVNLTDNRLGTTAGIFSSTLQGLLITHATIALDMCPHLLQTTECQRVFNHCMELQVLRVLVGGTALVVLFQANYDAAPTLIMSH